MLLLDMLGKLRGGLALLVQGLGQLGHTALMFLQTEVQVLGGRWEYTRFQNDLNSIM